MLTRPSSLKEIAETAPTLEAWGFALAEFLDGAHAVRRSGQAADVIALVRDEPPLLRLRFAEGETADAFGAALAEYLAESAARPAPAWTARPERFLREAWFPLRQIAGQPRLRALIERETPRSFREHNVFIDEPSLART
jgi:hypothetical protein